MLRIGHGTHAITAQRKREFDVVGPDTSTSVVGSSLTELHSAEQVRDGRQRTRNPAESSHFQLSGLALVVLVQDCDIMLFASVNIVKVFLALLRAIGEVNLSVRWGVLEQKAERGDESAADSLHIVTLCSCSPRLSYKAQN